jgi:hypothetical protein
MRTVPDDFDNVQALHSPYGAVRGIGTPMQSPADFVSTYTDHMMRPLMVDTMRRNDNDDHVSPSGLSSAFRHVGFAPSESMGSPDTLSPLSLNSTDRYYPSHLSSPMSAGPQSSNLYERPNSYGALSHSSQHDRPLQPLQLRETISRSRSESIHSTLRSSMSWKGPTLDYENYQTGQPSPPLSARQQSQYHPDQIGNNSANTHEDYRSAYSSSSKAYTRFHSLKNITHTDSFHRHKPSELTNSHDLLAVAWSFSVATAVALGDGSAKSLIVGINARLGRP